MALGVKEGRGTGTSVIRGYGTPRGLGLLPVQFTCAPSPACAWSQMYHFCNNIIAERCPSTACQAARKSCPSFQRWYWDIHHIIYCMLQGFCMLTRYFFIPYPFSEQKTEMQKKVSSFMSLSRISLLCISTNENRTLQVKESLVQFDTDFIYSNSFLLWVALVILTVHVCRPFTLPCTNSSSSSMSLLKFESISSWVYTKKRLLNSLFCRCYFKMKYKTV